MNLVNPPSAAFSIKRVARALMFFIALFATSRVQLHAELAQPVNLSTRMQVQTDDNVGIGGFVISGATKRVVLRALGPSLTRAGITGVLSDPVLELHRPDGVVLATNDNWKDDPNASSVQAAGLAPTDNLESALYTVLDAGSYTAIIRGKDNAIGVGLIEVYDLDPSAGSRLANISTRAFVQTGSNIVIAGFVLGDGAENRIAIRGIGPSLANSGVENVLPDPKLEVRNASGTLIISNDDWADSASQAEQLSNVGLAPNRDLESALIAAFTPGNYTALLSDLKNRSGVGLVEVYDLATATAGAEVAHVTRLKAGSTFSIEKQEVSFDPAQTTGSFVIQVYKPDVINRSGISARAALLGQTEPIPFTATAAQIVAALTSISNSYYAYDQPGNPELIHGSFSYFASIGADNREPVVTLTGANAAAGFTIEFGSLVGMTPTFTGYNTWAAGMPLITVTIPNK